MAAAPATETASARTVTLGGTNGTATGAATGGKTVAPCGGLGMPGADGSAAIAGACLLIVVWRALRN